MSISSAVSGHYTSSYYPRQDSGQGGSAVAAATGASNAMEFNGTAAGGSSLSALLGSIGLAGPDAATASTGPEQASEPVKPNLDALNRVLNHYRAQSDAVGVTVSLSA